jgi:hypothetical protein
MLALNRSVLAAIAAETLEAARAAVERHANVDHGGYFVCAVTTVLATLMAQRPNDQSAIARMINQVFEAAEVPYRLGPWTDHSQSVDAAVVIEAGYGVPSRGHGGTMVGKGAGAVHLVGDAHSSPAQLVAVPYGR